MDRIGIRILLVFAAGALVACASSSPPEPPANKPDFLAQQRAKTDAGPVGLLADACVLRDVVGGDFIVAGASEGMPYRPMVALRSLIMERGQSVPKPTITTVCAATDATTDTLAWAESRDHEPKPAPGRWVTTQTTSQTQAARLHRAVFETIRDSNGSYTLRALGVNTTDANDLRTALGADRAWLIQLSAVDVSSGKRVGQALGYTALTFPFFFVEPFAAAAVEGASDDVQRYTLALVDLKARELVWWKASKWVDPGSHFGAAYDADWAYRATSPLYP